MALFYRSGFIRDDYNTIVHFSINSRLKPLPQV